MIDVLADGAGLQLHARGARETLRTITLERSGGVVRKGAQHVRQAHRVLQRHAGALREILHHRVRGIAKQGDAAIDPASTGTRSRQFLPWRMIACARACTCAKPCITSSSDTGLPATGSGASLWYVT